MLYNCYYNESFKRAAYELELLTPRWLHDIGAEMRRSHDEYVNFNT
jgi:hypothetical protein